MAKQNNDGVIRKVIGDISSPMVFLIVSLATVFTTVSLVEGLGSVFSFVYTACWILIFVYLLVLSRDSLRIEGGALAFAGSVLAFALLNCIFFLLSGEPGYLTGYLVLLLKSFFLFLIGYFLVGVWSGRERLRVLERLLQLYVFASALLSVWVLCNYFPGLGNWLSNTQYLYANKNGAGQIISVAILIIFCAGVKRGFRISEIVVGLLLFATIILVQCRTAILAIGISMLAILVIENKKAHFIFLVLLIVGVVAAFPEIVSIVSHSLLLDKYQGASLDAMSSGRLGYWTEALDIAERNWLTGVGKYYVDNMYINAFANVGIFGLLIVLFILADRVWRNYRYAIKGTSVDLQWLPTMLFALTIFYLVVSLLEGYPPFGPGSCSFLFWLLSGFFDGCEQNRGPKAEGEDFDLPDFEKQ